MKRSIPDYNTLCEVLTPLVPEAWKPQPEDTILIIGAEFGLIAIKLYG